MGMTLDSKADQVKAKIIEVVTGQVPSIQAEAGDPGPEVMSIQHDGEFVEVPLVYPKPSAQSAPELFTNEELHMIWRLANDKLKEINASSFGIYVKSALPDIRRKIQGELIVRGDWED